MRNDATDANAMTAFLSGNRVAASAPARLDCGSTWDVKALALLGHRCRPSTLNIAINLRTHIQLLPFKAGWVKISGYGYRSVEFLLNEAPLTHPLGLVMAVLYHFGVSGVHVSIKSDAPPRAGLGGSGAVAVCLIAAVSRLIAEVRRERVLGLAEVVRLAHDIEDGLRISYTGLQDQLAAAYGGVNLWFVDYRRPRHPFGRETLVPGFRCPELSRHLLVVRTSSPKREMELTRTWVKGFLSNATRREWYSLKDASEELADALRLSDWRAAGRHLQRETSIRLSISPSMLSNEGSALVREAPAYDCGARFTGDGKGGCLWAIGPVDGIARLRERWRILLQRQQTGAFLQCEVDPHGLVGRIERV